MRRDHGRAALAAAVGMLLVAAPEARAQAPKAIERVKAAIVAVGTLQPSRSPSFDFRGTGFAVADGLTVVTNAHVLRPRSTPRSWSGSRS